MLKLTKGNGVGGDKEAGGDELIPMFIIFRFGYFLVFFELF